MAERALFVTSRRSKTPYWERNAWQGEVWKKAWQPQVGRREPLNAKTSPRERQQRPEKPLPPIQCSTPHWASARRVALYYFVFSNAGNASAAFFWGFWQVVLRRGCPASAKASARALCTCGDRCKSSWTEFYLRRTFLLCWEPLRTFFFSKPCQKQN